MYSNIYNKSNQKYPELKIQTFFSNDRNNNNSQYIKEKELRNNLDNITDQYNFIFGNLNKISNEKSGENDDLSILSNIKSKLKNLDDFNASEYGKFISELFEISNDTNVLNYDLKKYKENPAESDKKFKEIISKYKYEVVMGVNKNNSEENKKKLEKYINQKKGVNKAPNDNSNNSQGDVNNNLNNGQKQNNNQTNYNNYINDKKFENPNSLDDNDFNILEDDNTDNSNNQSNNNNYNNQSNNNNKFNNGNNNYNNNGNNNYNNNGNNSYNNNGNNNYNNNRNINNNYNGNNNNNFINGNKNYNNYIGNSRNNNNNYNNNSSKNNKNNNYNNNNNYIKNNFYNNNNNNPNNYNNNNKNNTNNNNNYNKNNFYNNNNPNNNNNYNKNNNYNNKNNYGIYNSYNNNYNNNKNNNNNSYGKSFYGSQLSYNNNKFENRNSDGNGYKEENINYVDPNQYDNNQNNSKIKVPFIYKGEEKNNEFDANENSDLILCFAIEISNNDNPKIYSNGTLIQSEYFTNRNIKEFVEIFGPEFYIY